MAELAAGGEGKVELEKPCDMLVNAVFDKSMHSGGMDLVVEIQLHLADILVVKEDELHFPYEIVRAGGIAELYGARGAAAHGGGAPAEPHGGVPAAPVGAPAPAERELAAELEAMRAENARLKAMLRGDAPGFAGAARTMPRTEPLLVERLNKAVDDGRATETSRTE